MGTKRHHVAGFSRTEIAIDVLSLMFAEVQHMGALTAIYCHSEDKGLGMSLASKFRIVDTEGRSRCGHNRAFCVNTSLCLA